MTFVTSLPPPFASRLPLGPEETILAALAADCDRHRRFAPCWFVITSHRLATIDADGLAVDLPLDTLSEVRVDELVGAARLMAKSSAGEQALISYSAHLIPEFATACRLADDAVKKRPVVLPEPGLIEPACCPRCGVPLSERGSPCRLCLPRRQVLRRLVGLLHPYRRKFLLLMALTLVTVVFQMLPPLCFMHITDQVIKDGAAWQLPWWISTLAVIYLANSALRMVTNNLTSWLGYRVVGDLRNRLHAKLQHLHMSYHNRHPSGELIGRVTHDCDQLQRFLVDAVPWILVNLLSFVAIACVLLSIQPMLAVLVFIPAPLILFGATWWRRRLIPFWHRHGNRIARMHSLFGESIKGVKSVKAAGQQDRRQDMFDDLNHQVVDVGYGTEVTWMRFAETMALTMALGTIGVWWLGSRLVLGSEALPAGASGKVTLGMLIAFVSYMGQFYGPLQWFTAVSNWAGRAMAGSDRIFQIFDLKAEDDLQPQVQALERVQGGIRLEDVRFSYERGKEVLKGLDLEISAGEMIGLVGRSGSGKSTIINLICRFYDPDSGRILIDGQPLNSFRLHDWRRQVGIVMQDPFLFHGTITDNIRYARPEASFDEVVRAARAAYAHEFILDKEDGYDTVIGEGGRDLSGGERQRLAIARAILTDPPVLILDEATSAVDSQTEKHIQEAIARLVKGRTTVAIAHRLATLRNAHRLVVIDDGRIVEIGTHEELMARPDGHFAKLVRLQHEINALRSEQDVWKA